MSCKHGNWESQGCDECDEQTAMWNRAYEAGRSYEREKAERRIEACLPIFGNKSQDYIDGVRDALAAVRGEGESNE